MHYVGNPLNRNSMRPKLVQMISRFQRLQSFDTNEENEERLLSIKHLSKKSVKKTKI
jgi:hypothetical protein